MEALPPGTGKFLGYGIPGTGIIIGSAYLPKDVKGVGFVVGSLLVGYGVYSLFNEKSKWEEGEEPNIGERYEVTITDPSEGEDWSLLRPHTIDVYVANPYATIKRIYYGMSITRPDGTVDDMQVRYFALNPGESKHTIYQIGAIAYKERGTYTIRASAWDVFPSGTCEVEETCHRLGDDMVNFTFSYL